MNTNKREAKPSSQQCPEHEAAKKNQGCLRRCNRGLPLMTAFFEGMKTKDCCYRGQADRYCQKYRCNRPVHRRFTAFKAVLRKPCRHTRQGVPKLLSWHMPTWQEPLQLQLRLLVPLQLVLRRLAPLQLGPLWMLLLPLQLEPHLLGPLQLVPP